MAVGVFGGSEIAPEDPLYVEGLRLGRLLAAAGYATCTGGYGGIMEAACRGAREAGGETIGVTCSAFGPQPANSWVRKEYREATLPARTQRLIELCGAFIILPGKAGTLAELSLLLALERAKLLSGKPVILVGGIWRVLLAGLETAGFLEANQTGWIRMAGTPEAAVRALIETPPARR